jgi:TatA/E family protein of Tat protein translocase
MEVNKMVWGIQEIAIVAVIAVMLFGAPKVIQWAKALGTAKKEFENACNTEIIVKQKKSA